MYFIHETIFSFLFIIYTSPAHVSEAEARQSLMGLAGDNCCWSSKPARDMTVESITSSNAFHVRM